MITPQASDPTARCTPEAQCLAVLGSGHCGTDEVQSERVSMIYWSPVHSSKTRTIVLQRRWTISARGSYGTCGRDIRSRGPTHKGRAEPRREAEPNAH